MSKNMYNQLLGLALMGAMFNMDKRHGTHHSMDELTEEDIESLKSVAIKKRKEISLSKGLKEFSIDGISILAINEKNAIRKINNIKKQLK